MTNSTQAKPTATTKFNSTKTKSQKLARKNPEILKAKSKEKVKVKKDIYQIVTDRVIAALENGVKPWACPWDRTNAFNSLPLNLKSGVAYSGINIMLLWSETVDKGFNSPYWLTYKQAAELGGNVIKGSKSTQIIYYKMLKVKNKLTGELEQIPMLKTFNVFNTDQIEGVKVPDFDIKADTKNKGFEAIAEIENMLSATGIEIVNQGVKAFYSSSFDKVTLPDTLRFDNSNDYYATAFHELVHATGHKTRLDRDLKNAFGSKDYAFEELIAELGAAFCCADVGIVGEVQHESYIASWLKKLNDDKRFIFKAASKASKAHQFIFNASGILEKIA